jgi:hypothetical protein
MIESDMGAFAPFSPSHVRRSSAQLFALPDSATKRTSPTFIPHGIQETPVKIIRFEDKLQHSHPAVAKYDSDKENERGLGMTSLIQNQPQSAPVVEEQSIYKSLGWDDGDDIDDMA